jgi:ADP-ribosyl-[dinitrogen reductase] hydrolase
MSRRELENFINRTARSTAGRPSSDLAHRYRGAMLGVAVGNGLGLPVEGRSKERIKERFPEGVTEIDPAERKRPWDDDLAQTVVLAEVVLERAEIDPDDLGRRLVHWASENGRGIGSQTSRVITQLAAEVKAAEAARSIWEQSGRTAAGNGAVMRCSPVALRWRRSGSRLVEESIKSAIVTHYDPRCTWSVVALNTVLALVLSGVEPDLHRLAGLLDDAGAPEEVDGGIRAAERCTLEELKLDGPDMGYTIKAMQVGLWASQQRNDFENVLVHAINAGGDTDTNGAVAGAIMGARCGASAIPRRWLENIRDTERLIALADALLKASA